MPTLPPHWKTGGGPSGGWGYGGADPMSTVQLITCPALSPSARRRGPPIGDAAPRAARR